MTRALPDRQPTLSVRCNRSIVPGPALGAAAWLWLAASVALAVVPGASLAGRAAAQDKPEPPRQFDEATAAAWKKAGAGVGWMGKNEYGFVEFRTQLDSLAAAVPAFRFIRWPENVLAKLPDPAVPFGLDLGGVTNAGLKELAGLKSLQALDLGGTKVTDAGVASLQKALPTCRIIR